MPGFPMHPLDRQIQAVEALSGKPVIAITINHEGLSADQTQDVCRRIERQTGRPTCDVLLQGADRIAAALIERIY
jgi:uncharacterized NAD-dependent epimerase/dehydratase family protein